MEDDIDSLMGVYELMEGKVVTGRAVWQKQGGAKEWFLCYGHGNSWMIGARKYMEVGSMLGYMQLGAAALTPDRARRGCAGGLQLQPSDVPPFRGYSEN
jgi:hypothetical protein